MPKEYDSNKNSSKELKDFVNNVAKDSHLKVEKDLGDGYFRLKATEAQRRQAAQDIRCSEDIVIEMLRNSRDAGAKNIYLATNRDNDFRNILVIDDGRGVPQHLHKTIFEPYVTSKLSKTINDMWGVHGRGMALYSIKENSVASEVVISQKDKGCSIYVKTNLKDLPEKKDQSTFPSFYVDQDSTLLVRGPKNIPRSVCEFAIENKSKVNVYLGSFAEIAATMYNIYCKKIGYKNLIFKNIEDANKTVEMLSYSSDPKHFKDIAQMLGLDMSERTARRIMDGELLTDTSILRKISKIGIKQFSSDSDDRTKSFSSTDKSKNKSADEIKIDIIKAIQNAEEPSLKVKLDQEDKELLKNSVKNAFDKIADKYFLESDIEPTIKIVNNQLSIKFHISGNNN